MYYKISGTSMAAPHVSGLVALIYAANPNLHWKEVKEIIISTVQPSKRWREKTVSGGVIDAEAAVKKAIEMLD
jgi:subtilisin family serine protease